MTEDEQPRYRRYIIIGLVVLALGAAAWSAKPLYRAWKKHRHLAHAEEFLAANDLKNAALSARLALNLDPANLTAARILARLTQQLRSPETLGWWQRVIELDPANVTNRLAGAEAALLFGEFVRAERLLAGIPETNRQQIAFYQTAALVLAGQRRLAEAQALYAAALKLAPTNELLRINHAVILLQSTDTNLARQARATLTDASTRPTYRRYALQNLAEACLRAGDTNAALTAARELAQATNATFADHMLELSLQHRAAASGYAATLAAQQRRAAQDGPEAVHAVAAWMLSTQQSAEAERWLATLPAELQSKQRVSMARADLHLARGEWAQLQATLENARWPDAEFLRRAFLARAFREQRQTVAAQAEWLAATRAAAGQPKVLSALARLAGAWNWPHEEEELLWTLLERHPAERWAPARLAEILFPAGDTRGLNRLYQTLWSQNPDNLAAKNNLAVTTLLLTPQSTRAADLARELFQRNPTNEIFASTHAFALFVQGHRAEALQAFAKVPAAALAAPNVALYYGLILGTNSPAEAARYLDLAAATSLLPEERARLAEARQALAPR